MPDIMIGKRIGEFIVEDRLGQGAMAVVYKAYQPSINRYVALKVIHLNEGQGHQEDFRQRFAHEAEIIASLEHIHILPIYGYGITDEYAYLAMRWLKGGTLSQLMRQGPIPLDRAADIFIQIAKGLAYAHSQGVIHRDLKPSNIMLDDTGNAYLSDFGLAKLVENSVEITKTGNIVGTPAYMSPEQLRGEALDYRTDIYSLGVLLYNMMVGRLPFDITSGDVVSVIYKHLEQPPTPPSELNPDIPPAVEVVILKALSKNRDDRYASALDMAKALQLALGRSSESMTEISPPITGSSQIHAVRPSRPALNWVLGTIALILIVALVSLLFLQNNNTLQQQNATTLTAVVEGATGTAAQWTATPLPLPTVLVGEKSASADIKPTTAQIAQAKTRLSTDGFIAFIACNLTSEFHAALAREVRSTVEDYGLPYKVYDSNNDPGTQSPLIERARSEGATGIILCPLGSMDLLKTSLSSIEQDHFPLVLFTPNPPTFGGILIGSDNYQLGLSPGQFAGKLIHDEMDGKANAIILDYPSLDYLVQRANGLEDGVKQLAPDVNIIGRYQGGTREAGKASVSKLIQSGVKFNFILSINDQGSYGAIDAMQEAGWDCNAVTIVSVDAEDKAEDYIRKGCFIRGSLQTSWYDSAHAMVDSMVLLLAAQTLPETIVVPPGSIITKDVLDNEDATSTTEALTSTPPP